MTITLMCLCVPFVSTVFFVIAVGLALRKDLSGETVQNDWYDWGLFLTFLVLVPGAFVATCASKVWSAGKTLSDTSIKGSFSRLRFGLASESDRDKILWHVQTIRSSVGPLYEAGICPDLGKPIEGSSGTLLCIGEYKATASAEPTKCAVKIRPLLVDGLPGGVDLRVEAAIMTGSAGQHVNICHMFRAAESGGHHYLAMQLCEATLQSATRDGSLQAVLGQSMVVGMLRGVAEGVSALHSSAFVHNCVTPSNVLLVDGVPKLSGFSSAAQITQPTTTLDTNRVNKDYRAMEVSTSGSHSVECALPTAADVYALGGTFHFVLTGGNTAGTRQSVVKSEVLAHEARDLIGSMLDENAEERPSMQAVLNHPMFWPLETKIRYLGESVGLMLPVKIHKLKSPFITDLEAIADKELGAYDEVDPEKGGSWARLLDPRYPLPGVNNDGWGKAQRPPVEEERNYAIFGGPPGKKQIKEREDLLTAGKPLGGHAAKEIRTVGLLKFIRNLSAHAGQTVSVGRFESEDALWHYMLDPFPWLMMAVYRTDEKHGLTDVPNSGDAIGIACNVAGVQ